MALKVWPALSCKSRANSVARLSFSNNNAANLSTAAGLSICCLLLFPGQRFPRGNGHVFSGHFVLNQYLFRRAALGIVIAHAVELHNARMGFADRLGHLYAQTAVGEVFFGHYDATSRTGCVGDRLAIDRL